MIRNDENDVDKDKKWDDLTRAALSDDGAAKKVAEIQTEGSDDPDAATHALNLMRSVM